MSSFAAYNIPTPLVKILKELGFVDMSPVQEKSIPSFLNNKSLVCKAPTGSGKTLAYLVPMLSDLSDINGVQGLIIVPTKVLVNQVKDVLAKIKKAGYNFTYQTIIDGESFEKKIQSDIVIATPKMALLLPQSANLKPLKRIVFDEGDMLIFGGFAAEVEEILSWQTSASKSIFTASIDEHVLTLVKKYIKACDVIDVSDNSINASRVKHHLVNIRNMSKGEAVCSFIRAHNPYKTIVFVSKKEDIDEVKNHLIKLGKPFSVIHGDLPKRDQKRAYNEFNRDETHILLASDLAARGVDIPDVTDVISVDLPKDLVYYFHRAGRTGRFDKEGNSYVFYVPGDVQKVKELIKKGVIFDYFTLKNDELKTDRNLLENKKTTKGNNEVLEKQIRAAVNKVRTNKVKPNYKKKMKVAAERAKERHKRKIIRTNLRKKDVQKSN